MWGRRCQNWGRRNWPVRSAEQAVAVLLISTRQWRRDARLSEEFRELMRMHEETSLRTPKSGLETNGNLGGPSERDLTSISHLTVELYSDARHIGLRCCCLLLRGLP
jgi:hypothetical protein